MSEAGKKKPSPGTIEAIQTALGQKAHQIAGAMTFKPTKVWMVVAFALEPISVAVAATRGRSKEDSQAVYADLAATLQQSSRLKKVAGESVRQYFPRIMGGKYDAKLNEIGYRRTGTRVEPIIPEATPAQATIPDKPDPAVEERPPVGEKPATETLANTPSEIPGVTQASLGGSGSDQVAGAEADGRRRTPIERCAEPAAVQSHAAAIVEIESPDGASAPRNPNASRSLLPSRPASSARFTAKSQPK